MSAIVRTQAFRSDGRLVRGWSMNLDIHFVLRGKKLYSSLSFLSTSL